MASSNPSIEAFFHRVFASYRRAIERGVLAAVPDAIAYCRTHQLMPPDWLLESAERLMADQLTGRLPKGVGRTANPMARYRQDMIDFTRWDNVTTARSKREEIRGELAGLRALNKAPRHLIQEPEKLLRFVRSDAAIFRLVSYQLRGSEAQGSPEAIEWSYKKVERASESGRLRYFLLSSQSDERLGLKHIFEAPAGKKPPSFFPPPS